MEQNHGFGKKLYQVIDVLYLEVETAELLRIAGDEEDVIRDSNGTPILPGTSIAGAVQDYLKERKDRSYCTFWGNERFDNKVYFFDSPLLSEPDNAETALEKRTRHKHDAKYGGAEEEKLFPENYLKSGSRFGIVVKAFALREEKEMVNHFFADLVNGLESGAILLGSNKNNGCGQIHVISAKKAEFDFTNPADYVKYYEFVPNNGLSECYAQFDYQSEVMNREQIKLTLHASIRDALLIRAEQVGKQDAEYQVIEPMKSNGEFIIPGSTVKGILRGYCNKICNTLELKEEIRKQWIELLFGTDSEDCAVKEGQKENWHKKGCIRIKDVVIREPAQLEYTRIKIDRFTGGTITGAKMASNPVTRGKLSIQLEIKPELRGEREELEIFRSALMLLYLALRDLGQGKIPIGSFSSVGFGRLKSASLKMNIPYRYSQDEWELDIKEVSDHYIAGSAVFGDLVTYSEEVKRFLDKCMSEFKQRCEGGQ